MITQNQFHLLIRPGLRKDFRDAYQYHENEYDKFLNTGNMDKPELQATIMTGMNRLVELGDGEPVTYDDPKIGPKVVGVDREFGLGFLVTLRTMEDDQYGKARQSSKWLGHAVNMTKEYRAGGFLDDAFTGTHYKGIDGLSLCNANHTLLKSPNTVANTLTQNIGLSLTGVTAMYDLVHQMKDENGDPIVMAPKTLIHGNNAGDAHRAIQIFESDKEPFTAENQDNAIKKKYGKPKLVQSHYKTSLRSWFMVDEKWSDAHFLTRRQPTYEDTMDFDTGAAKFKVTTRFMIWFVDWRGWFGSNPV